MPRPSASPARTRAALVALAVACATACSSATGEVSGGEPRFDAALPEPFDAGPAEDADLAAPPTSWRGIYRDLFGKSAPSSCAGTASCHGALGQQGVSSARFLCSNVDECYDSMRSKGADKKLQSGLVVDADIGKPDDALLFKVLRTRRADGSVSEGTMPARPADFAFSQAQIANLTTWITNGAKKD